MKITIAIDSFKGSLSSVEAGCAVRDGILSCYADAEIHISPLADGGEGFTKAFIYGVGGKLHSVEVTGPLGKKVNAEFGILNDGVTAVIEIAEAAGITLIPKEKLNPLITTTYGVGEIIKVALKKGCRKFWIGVGGSATNDGGLGMLQALGAECIAENGLQVAYGAYGLKQLKHMTVEKFMPELKECEFSIICDVGNTLTGKNGSSYVYARQKGASDAEIRQMDVWMQNYVEIAKKINPLADENYPGCGAAGGLGFCFLTFLNAKLMPGAEFILRKTRLEEYIKNSDLVITGEGCLDGQTVMGKAPIGVARFAKKYKKPVIAFSGCVKDGAQACNEYGIDAYFPILRSIVSYEEAMDKQNAAISLQRTCEQVFRLIKMKIAD